MSEQQAAMTETGVHAEIITTETLGQAGDVMVELEGYETEPETLELGPTETTALAEAADVQSIQALHHLDIITFEATTPAFAANPLELSPPAYSQPAITAAAQVHLNREAAHAQNIEASLQRGY